MHRSRQIANQKVLSAEEMQLVVEEDEEEVKGLIKSNALSPHQKQVNQKLKSVGLLEKDMSWEEKDQIITSLDASLHTAQNEDVKRKSIHKNLNKSSRQKDLSKSFVTFKKQDNKEEEEEEQDDVNEIGIVYCHTPTMYDKIKKKTKDFLKVKEVVKKNNSQIDKLQGKAGSSKKVADAKEMCYDTDTNHGVRNMKRPSPESIESGDSVKRMRSNQEDWVESKRKPVSVIAAELDKRIERWKRAIAKYKIPLRWSEVKIGECESENWVGSKIPQHHLNKYKQFLSSKKTTHPIFSFMVSEPQDMPSPLVKKEIDRVSNNEHGEVDEKTNEKKEEVATSEARWLTVKNDTFKPKVATKLNNEETQGRQYRMFKTKNEIPGSSEKLNNDNKDIVTTSDLKTTNTSVPTTQCPICGKEFSIDDIQDHATECATDTFQD